MNLIVSIRPFCTFWHPISKQYAAVGWVLIIEHYWPFRHSKLIHSTTNTYILSKLPYHVSSGDKYCPGIPYFVVNGMIRPPILRCINLLRPLNSRQIPHLIPQPPSSIIKRNMSRRSPGRVMPIDNAFDGLGAAWSKSYKSRTKGVGTRCPSP